MLDPGGAFGDVSPGEQAHWANTLTFYYSSRFAVCFCGHNYHPPWDRDKDCWCGDSETLQHVLKTSMHWFSYLRDAVGGRKLGYDTAQSGLWVNVAQPLYVCECESFVLSFLLEWPHSSVECVCARACVRSLITFSFPLSLPSILHSPILSSVTLFTWTKWGRVHVGQWCQSPECDKIIITLMKNILPPENKTLPQTKKLKLIWLILGPRQLTFLIIRPY